MKSLLKEIGDFLECASKMAHSPRLVVSFNQQSKIIIIGQAPGSIVHKTGVSWDDKIGRQFEKMDVD